MDDRNLYGKASGLNERGRHATFASSVDAAFASMIVERNPFLDSVTANWSRLFPSLPVKPGRYESGVIYLYVANATTSYAMRSRLPKIKQVLASLPGAPAKLVLRLEIHS